MTRYFIYIHTHAHTHSYIGTHAYHWGFHCVSKCNHISTISSDQYHGNKSELCAHYWCRYIILLVFKRNYYIFSGGSLDVQANAYRASKACMDNSSSTPSMFFPKVTWKEHTPRCLRTGKNISMKLRLPSPLAEDVGFSVRGAAPFAVNGEADTRVLGMSVFIVHVYKNPILLLFHRLYNTFRSLP